MDNFGRKEIADYVASKTGLEKEVAWQATDAVLDGIMLAIASGKKSELRQFGVFVPRTTKRRVGRNPAKPEQSVMIEARETVKFKPSPHFHKIISRAHAKASAQ